MTMTLEELKRRTDLVSEVIAKTQWVPRDELLRTILNWLSTPDLEIAVAELQSPHEPPIDPTIQFLVRLARLGRESGVTYHVVQTEAAALASASPLEQRWIEQVRKALP